MKQPFGFDYLGKRKDADASFVSSDGMVFPLHFDVINLNREAQALNELFDKHRNSADKVSQAAAPNRSSC